MKYRKMKLSDLFKIGELERTIFKDPWSVSSCRGALENNCVYAVVAEDDDGIAGYGFMMGTQDEAEILRVAVVPEKRRQHIGSELLEDMLDYGDYENYTNIFLEVRAGNEAALALYKKCGFVQNGLRPKYYDGVDAILMQKEI